MTTMRTLHLLGATGAARTATLHGREHLVVPVVALMEGVIHAVNSSVPEFVPLATLQKAAASWNGRPIVLGHPRKDGRQCSANSPGIFDSHGIGTIFDARVEGYKLLCDAWVDVEKAKALNREMYDRLLARKPVEVSVGAFVVTDNKGGDFKGKAYKAAWLETTGDHLAFLPGGVGACSVEMGCGTHRAAMRMCEGGMEMETLSNPEGVNQYTHGGASSAHEAANGAHKEALAANREAAKPGASGRAKEIASSKSSKADELSRKADAMTQGIQDKGMTRVRGESTAARYSASDANRANGESDHPTSHDFSRAADHHASAMIAHREASVSHQLKQKGIKALDGAMPDKAQVEVQGGRMKVGSKVKINKPGHAAHGKTGAITSSKGGKHAVGDHGSFFPSELKAAQADTPDTPEAAASEEAAELITYNTMRTLMDACGAQWDEASGLIDALIADETESPTETAAEEEAEEDVETARLDAVRALCQSMIGALSGVIGATYAQSLTDAPNYAGLAGAMIDCEACNGTGQVSKDGKQQDCAACEGAGQMKALAGARHSQTDMKAIQAVHDHSMALGATCDRGNYKTLKLTDAEFKINRSNLRTAVVRHEGGKWVLYTKDGSRRLGAHDTEAEAVAQERAIEAAKHRRNLELTGAGTGGNDEHGRCSCGGHA